MLLYPILGLVIGVAFGLVFPVSLPISYAKLLSLSLLAGFDSVFGGIRSAYEGTYNNTIFLTGFFSNALLAAGLAYVGERMGIDLYIVALLAFGLRVFQNLAIIRRHLLNKKEKIDSHKI